MLFDSAASSAPPKWPFRLIGSLLILAALAGCFWIVRMTRMPLSSYRGKLPVLTEEQTLIKQRLERHVRYLSETVGERSLAHRGSLSTTMEYLRRVMTEAGYSVSAQSYSVGNEAVNNLEAHLPGVVQGSGIVVVGAHYDTVRGSTGANDNATGVAAVLELARILKGSRLHHSVYFVFFVNEEPPFFQTDAMGSFQYARQLRRDVVPVTAMISLETIGYYSDAANSQKYPPLLGSFYPDQGNFVGFVGNSGSGDLLRASVRAFRQSTSFPSEGISAPEQWPGVGWSDHWSFWKEEYPAIMMTDTAVFRDPFYHTGRDSADRLNYDKMARVVEGTRHVIEALATE